jgi:hypothetical protein
MSQVTNLAFFRARRGESEALGADLAALVEPTRLAQLRYSSRCADVFILYFPNKTRRICSGSSSYNMGQLLGHEGVAQNIPSGRDDFLESPVGMLIAILKTST